MYQIDKTCILSYILSIELYIIHVLRNLCIYLCNIFTLILGSMDEKRVSKSLEIFLDQQPDLKELTTHARTAQWYHLGILLNLDGEDLRGYTDLTSMYQLWIQEKAEMATRRNLLTALRSLRQNNVAMQYEDYLKTKVS